MKVRPSSRRWRIADEPDGFRISLPARRNWGLLVLLSLWLCGWAVGQMAVVRLVAAGATFAGGMPGVDCLLVLAWLVIWTLAGMLALCAWAYNLAGRETVRFTSLSLTLRRAVCSVGPSREFDLSHVRNLRMTEPPADMRTWALYLWGAGTRALAFDYGAKTYRFAAGLEEPEAVELLRAIRERVNIRDAANETGG